MFYFRLNKVKIRKNREFLGRAEVRFFSFITTDDKPLPDIHQYFETNDQAEKQAIIEAAVGAVLHSNIFPQVDRIRDGAVMTFGDTGITLFQTDKVPEHFSWYLLAVDNDKRTRDNAALALQIIDDDGFGTFVTNVGTLIGVAANPAFALSVAIAKFVATTILKIVKEDKDDQIGFVMMSLSRTEHYLHGIRNADDVADLSGNMLVDYAIFSN